MAETLKVQLEDSEGNIYYLKTNANSVYCEDGSSVEAKLNAKIDKDNIVQNATTNDASKIASASVVKSLQDQLTEQSMVSIGNNQLAYVTFTNYGDYWWISSPIPCYKADQFNIKLLSNIQNTTTSNKCTISSELFEIRKYKNNFYILTNNQEIAGYIFSNTHPNIIWEIQYSVLQ